MNEKQMRLGQNLTCLLKTITEKNKITMENGLNVLVSGIVADTTELTSILKDNPDFENIIQDIRILIDQNAMSSATSLTLWDYLIVIKALLLKWPTNGNAENNSKFHLGKHGFQYDYVYYTQGELIQVWDDGPYCRILEQYYAQDPHKGIAMIISLYKIESTHEKQLVLDLNMPIRAKINIFFFCTPKTEVFISNVSEESYPHTILSKMLLSTNPVTLTLNKQSNFKVFNTWNNIPDQLTLVLSDNFDTYADWDLADLISSLSSREALTLKFNSGALPKQLEFILNLLDKNPELKLTIEGQHKLLFKELESNPDLVIDENLVMKKITPIPDATPIEEEGSSSFNPS